MSSRGFGALAGKERSFVPKNVLKELSNGRLGTSEATLAPNMVKSVLPIWP